MTTINDMIRCGKIYKKNDDNLDEILSTDDISYDDKLYIKYDEKRLMSGAGEQYFAKLNPFDTVHKNAEAPKSEATIESVCDALKEFLLAKNKNYGNSATEPVRVFSKSNANEGILVRMDDKLSRIKNSESPALNDTVDLLGYLVLLCKNNNWDDFKGMID